MRQFGLYRESSLPVVHIVTPDVHRWTRRGVAGLVSWVEGMQPYVDAWATASENVVTEDRPHDDNVWEAFIQWYTSRTQTRVMYVPPQSPTPVPDAARILSTITYPVRWDQHYDSAYYVIAGISHILGKVRTRHVIGHQEIEQTWDRMHDITTSFLAVVKYRGNLTLPLFPRYPQSSSTSASTSRSYQAPSSSSWPPFPFSALSFVPHPLMHPKGDQILE